MTEPSGVDLARVALQQARATAKQRPAKPPKKPVHASSKATGRDPVALGGAIHRMMAERAWDVSVQGGQILSQWASIAPQLAGNVAAEHFDEETGTLHLRPASPAYRTQLNLRQQQIVDVINAAMGGSPVKALKVLPVGAPQARPETAIPEQPAPASIMTPSGPRMPEERHPGFRAALAAHLASPGPQVYVDPRVPVAAERQIRSRLREPEGKFTELMWQERDRADAEHEQMRARFSGEDRYAAACRKAALGKSGQSVPAVDERLRRTS
jgi:predicted nucleic acid-binding Zn ribbon protein